MRKAPEASLASAEWCALILHMMTCARQIEQKTLALHWRSDMFQCHINIKSEMGLDGGQNNGDHERMLRERWLYLGQLWLGYMV